jgi:hypothetical protein
MDLTHSGWSDIFFLGMDFPEGARVLNISIDLAVRSESAPDGAPRPPVEAYFRVIDQPVLRLTSVDLQSSADVTNVAEVFDFARDYLGLLKACRDRQWHRATGHGRAPPSRSPNCLCGSPEDPATASKSSARVNDIPKGSRLRVSTNLLACLIAVCMRATNQIHALTGSLEEHDRRW